MNYLNLNKYLVELGCKRFFRIVETIEFDDYITKGKVGMIKIDGIKDLVDIINTPGITVFVYLHQDFEVNMQTVWCYLDISNNDIILRKFKLKQLINKNE